MTANLAKEERYCEGMMKIHIEAQGAENLSLQKNSPKNLVSRILT